MGDAKPRLQKEFKALNDAGFSVEFNDSNMFIWNGTVEGPEDTPYTGGYFEYVIEFPNSFPFEPPVFKFITPIYHPNISEKGITCIPLIEKSNWAAGTPITKVLEYVLNILHSPDPEKAFNQEACTLFNQNVDAFNKKAAEETDKHANPFK